jgi:hypothetical protein
LKAATVATLNSPEGLVQLSLIAGSDHPHRTSDLIREVVLRCISFNGIPRTINTLAALGPRGPPLSEEELLNVKDESQAVGIKLWKSIYGPHATNLIKKLGSYHPDLPRMILHHHYTPMLGRSWDGSFAPGSAMKSMVGRILTSVIACACLRAQTGAHMQLTSHVYGLLNAYTARDGSEDLMEVDPQGIFSTEKGIMILLVWVDKLVAQFKPETAIMAMEMEAHFGPASSIEDILESSELK